MEEKFINAIRAKQKIKLTFYSKEDIGVLVRTCAPMDFGPSSRAKEKNNRYHVWDYDSDTGTHVLSLNPEQIASIEVLDEHFEPSNFITWDTQKSPWFVTRDWENFS